MGGVCLVRKGRAEPEFKFAATGPESRLPQTTLGATTNILIPSCGAIEDGCESEKFVSSPSHTFSMSQKGSGDGKMSRKHTAQ